MHSPAGGRTGTAAQLLTRAVSRLTPCLFRGACSGRPSECGAQAAGSTASGKGRLDLRLDTLPEQQSTGAGAHHRQNRQTDAEGAVGDAHGKSAVGMAQERSFHHGTSHEVLPPPGLDFSGFATGTFWPLALGPRVLGPARTYRKIDGARNRQSCRSILPIQPRPGQAAPEWVALAVLSLDPPVLIAPLP